MAAGRCVHPIPHAEARMASPVQPGDGGVVLAAGCAWLQHCYVSVDAWKVAKRASVERDRPSLALVEANDLIVAWVLRGYAAAYPGLGGKLLDDAAKGVACCRRVGIVGAAGRVATKVANDSVELRAIPALHAARAACAWRTRVSVVGDDDHGLRPLRRLPIRTRAGRTTRTGTDAASGRKRDQDNGCEACHVELDARRLRLVPE
jgi:hypothetical protein